MRLVECPHCGAGRNLQNCELYADDDSETVDCRECGREFIVTVSFFPTYTVTCLDNEHDIKPVPGHDHVQCSKCEYYAARDSKIPR